MRGYTCNEEELTEPAVSSAEHIAEPGPYHLYAREYPGEGLEEVARPLLWQIMHEWERSLLFAATSFIKKEEERNDNTMKQTTQITVEHIVVTSDNSYEHVIEALEAQLGQRADWDALQQVITTNASWEQAIQLIEEQLGTSGFTIFSKLEPGNLLTISGKPMRAAQYAIGNPLLAIQMIKHAPEAALYAPLRLAVYENRADKAVVAYERFTSQLAQYPYPEIVSVARLVEQKLEALIAEAAGEGQETPVSPPLPQAPSLPEERPIHTVQERAFTEHRIQRGTYGISARHFAGAGPAFVFMHGFPDNLHIYDRLIPYLYGREVITFDFLGWGDSDKPMGYSYTSKEQEGDLQAVLDALGVEQVVLVPHDASGPVAINWALDHPERVAALALLNTYYAQAPALRFPPFIHLFADPAYAALTRAMVQEPTVTGWLLQWQAKQFGAEDQGMEILRPIVLHEFAGTPSTFPAFMALTSGLEATLRADTQRLPQLATFERPVHVIFGAGDPYLNPGVAEQFHEAFPTSELFLLHAGHWPQIDSPEEVARLLLSVPVTTQCK